MTHVQTQTTRTLRESLRLYAWLFLIPIRRELRYRSELLLSILSTLIGIFIQVTVWTALYTGRKQVAGIALADMLSYVFLASVIGTFTSSSAAGALERMMSSGDIARELLRPMNLAVRIFVMDLGSAAYRFFTRVFPLILLGLVWLPLRAPETPVHLLGFLALLTGAAVIGFYINYLIGLLAFWFLSVMHLSWFIGIGVRFFSGAVVPLWFFPDGLREVAEYLPFKLMYFVPNAFYLGKLEAARIPSFLLLQAFWILIFALLGRFLWRRAVQRIVIQGG